MPHYQGGREIGADMMTFWSLRQELLLIVLALLARKAVSGEKDAR